MDIETGMPQPVIIGKGSMVTRSYTPPPTFTPLIVAKSTADYK